MNYCVLCHRTFRDGERVIPVWRYIKVNEVEGVDREDPELVHFDHLAAVA